MAMFSMKPKFDLAEFLAEPARAGTRTKPRQYSRPPAATPTPEDKQKSTETKK